MINAMKPFTSKAMLLAMIATLGFTSLIVSPAKAIDWRSLLGLKNNTPSAPIAEPIFSAQNPATTIARATKNMPLGERVSRGHFIPRQQQARPSQAMTEAPALSDALPDIDSFQVPVIASGLTDAQVSVEIFSSTEKATKNPTDNWLIEMATRFNSETKMPGKITIRRIDSGMAYQFLLRQKADPYTSYGVEAFAPSNDLWVRMAQAQGVRLDRVSESLVSNVAGLVIRKSKLRELGFSAERFTIVDLIGAVNSGRITIGYTNPFASSTGINFLGQALSQLTTGFRTSIESPEVLESFKEFQGKGVPTLYETTLQMRDAIVKGAKLDAMAMEYQTYINTTDLKETCDFVPFGERHNNPLYASNDLSPQKRAVLDAFVKWLERTPDAKNLAKKNGFGGLPDYRSPVKVPTGSELISMQKIWKRGKDSKSTVAALFVGDISGSMDKISGDTSRIAMVRKALTVGANFIRPETRIGLIVFDDFVTRALPVESFNENQKNDFLSYANSLKPVDGTAMYDAIAVALYELAEQAKKIPDIKLRLIVLSDGESTSDKNNRETVIKVARQMKIPLYMLAMEASSELMAKMKEDADSTGGAAFAVTPKTVESVVAGLMNSQL